MSKINKKFDLEERTACFGENVIDLCRNIRKDIISDSIIRQLIRSATSIGANYMEANGVCSKKDFIHKCHLCKKEAKESMHWLRMLSKAISDNDKYKDRIHTLWQEAKELSLIFGKICIN
jgi:four helix bundle protein